MGQVTQTKPAQPPATTVKPIEEVRHQLEVMTAQFEAALPAHIPVERFKRVVMTALQNNPDLIKCTRQSLWNSCMKAAQDGLLPDSREGAIVPYKGQAQWLPMVFGIRKKVRNSGEISTWEVHAVYEKDSFAYELGDQPFIRHRPFYGKGTPGEIIAAYSVAVMKDGSISREVMSIWEIDQVRKSSRGTNTPWNVPEFYPEMCKKTVARRHAKVLPMSTDLDDLIRRDDELYDLKGASDKEKKPPRPELEDFMNTPDTEIEGEKAEEEKPVEETKADANNGKGEPEKKKTDETAQEEGNAEDENQDAGDYGPPEAMADGRAVRDTNKPCRVPETWVANKQTALIEAFKKGYDDRDAEIKAAKKGK